MVKSMTLQKKIKEKRVVMKETFCVWKREYKLLHKKCSPWFLEFLEIVKIFLGIFLLAEN